MACRLQNVVALAASATKMDQVVRSRMVRLGGRRGRLLGSTLLEETTMLRWAILFLVIALIASLFSFGFVAGISMEAAKILFFVFIVLAVLSFIGGAFRSPPPV
jgi:uncharacterized membrane protein YtjA (UPF0391 family)